MNLSRTALWMIYLLHGGFALLLFLQPQFTPKKKEHKTLLVKTITPKPSTALATKPVRAQPKHSPQVARPSIPPRPKAPPQPQTARPAAPAVKKTAPSPAPSKKEPAIADKKIAPAHKTPPPKPAPAQRAMLSESLLQELEESIARIEQKSHKTAAIHKESRAAPIALQVDASSSDGIEAQDPTYADKLVEHLRQTLQLPSYGEVKIQLSLRQDGSVIKLVVLNTQSKENKRYLEEHLPYLRFPRFEGPLAHQHESSFILTFTNEV